MGTDGVGIVLILQVDDPGLKETVSQYLFRALWCVLASGIELRQTDAKAHALSIDPTVSFTLRWK